MKSFIKVTVTKEHIKKGRQAWKKGARRFESCPIHCAVRKIFDERFYIYIDTIRFDDDLLSHGIPLPEDAKQFINDFDNDRPVKPFTFYLPMS